MAKKSVCNLYVHILRQKQIESTEAPLENKFHKITAIQKHIKLMNKNFKPEIKKIQSSSCPLRSIQVSSIFTMRTGRVAKNEENLKSTQINSYCFNQGLHIKSDSATFERLLKVALKWLVGKRESFRGVSFHNLVPTSDTGAKRNISFRSLSIGVQFLESTVAEILFQV